MADGDALPATIPSRSPAVPEPRQRAAALVLAIGSGKAGAILDHLSPDEVALLAEEVDSLGTFDTSTRNNMMAQTLTHLMSIDPATEAATLRARAKQMEALRGLAPGERHVFDLLSRVELDQAVRFLGTEHPQTAAVILSAQPAEVAAKMLAALEPEVAGDIALRIATIATTPPELIERIEIAMRERLTEAKAENVLRHDGPKELAAILNNAAKDTEESVLEHLTEQDSELAEYVRSLMFVFEDVVDLDDRAVQQVLQQVNTASLALALKGAPDEVRDKLLRNLSERAREALLEEIDLLGAVRKPDVMEARSSVVATIRALEESGQIVIARGGESDLIE
ncbi:MAG: flagellar motor switch protein FliG [Acidimicrobiia bacterium]|nr:flagellar motor switch protein FliG [Acidimicrobiia bacterium]MDH4309328.1 flagellar motor switch protein FliG [Acidimicrobiia bacterium]MDH5292224.1 flagellar motor switch protein FliG [Acidimicrobiia bacterium]